MSKKALSDIVISKAIVESFTDKFIKSLRTEVAIVGGGPAGAASGRIRNPEDPDFPELQKTRYTHQRRRKSDVE